MHNNNSDEQSEPTMKDVMLVLEKNQHYLEEISRWSKIEGARKLANILNEVLDTPEKKTVYNLSDGKTTREINSICGVSIGTISKYWNSWDRLGLMKTMSVNRGERFIKAFELEDYGIDIPSITPRIQPQQNNTTGPDNHNEVDTTMKEGENIQ